MLMEMLQISNLYGFENRIGFFKTKSRIELTEIIQALLFVLYFYLLMSRFAQMNQ